MPPAAVAACLVAQQPRNGAKTHKAWRQMKSQKTCMYSMVCASGGMWEDTGTVITKGAHRTTGEGDDVFGSPAQVQ